MTTMNTLTNGYWDNNHIQFPRLISEIIATQSLDMDALAASMDLETSEVDELLSRAQFCWDNIRDALETGLL